MSDEALVTAYLGGDDQALRALAERYLGALARYALRFGDRQDAADIAQESFVKAWKALATYDPCQPFRPWLYRIVHNTGIDWTRRRRNVPFSVLEEAGCSIADTMADDALRPDEIAQRTEQAAWVRSGIAGLPEAYRSVIALRYGDERSFEDIAAELGRPASTVRSQHRRALAMLHGRLVPRHS